MEAVFLETLNMSLTAGYVIATVLFVRLLLKRAPKKYAYALWSVVGFRLCCPVSFQSAFSLFRLKPFDMTAAQLASGGAALTYVLEDIGMMAQPQVTFGIPAANAAIAGSLPAATPAYNVNPMQVAVAAGAFVWCVGAAVLALYSVVMFIRLHLRLRTAIRMEKNIYQSEYVCSPFVLGFFRPRIYLPFALDEDARSYVLAHERYHIRHLDHLVKLFAFALLCLHWFNPLCWLAFVLMSRDMEMRCDEWVLGGQADMRRAYTTTLLSFAANRRFPAPGPLAFGESGVRARISNALRWKRPKLWLTVIATVLCIAAVAACAANPQTEPGVLQPFGSTYRVEEIVYSAPYYSFSYTCATAPVYCLSVDGVLLSAPASDNPQVFAEWEFLGSMEEIALSKENFDRYFRDTAGEVSGWREGSSAAASVRRENQTAWRLLRETDNFTELYYVLQQDSGAVYLAYGYYDLEGETDPESDDSRFRWLFALTPESSDSASVSRTGGADAPENGSFSPTGGADMPAAEVYVSSQCLYMTPLSSQFSGPDSGCRYFLDEKVFQIENRGSGIIERFSLPEDGWTEFPYTQKAWDEMFLLWKAPQLEQYKERMYMALGNGYALMKMDRQLWLLQRWDTAETTLVWSLYTLTPEDGMGVASWAYQPLLSSRFPAFAFRFALPEDAEISLVCVDGALLDAQKAVSESGVLSIPGGQFFYWSPGSPDSLASNAQLHCVIHMGEESYSGTIYIESGDCNTQEGVVLYTARPVGDFTIRQQEDAAELSV